MATTCPSFLRGNVMRVTRLNNCGQPIYGECNQVVSDGFVTVSLSAEIQEGEEVTVTKANGRICISDKACDQLRWYTVETEFCEVDPDLIQMMNPTWEKVLDAQGNVVGWDAKGSLDCDTGFALEIWMDTYGATDVCTGQEAQGSWGYLILPWVVGGAPGDIEIGNDAISFSFTGRTKAAARWGRGPYPVQLQANNVPGPLLTPITSDTQYRLFVTTVRPPEAECGCLPVDRPTPEPAELTITGANDSPRMTVRLRPDNHGFGPVSIDWGDGTDPQESNDGTWVNHIYEEPGTYTITVCDVETPQVCVSREVTIPLPADEPTLELRCAGTANPFEIAADITFPSQASGGGNIDWGDGTAREDFTVGADGTLTVSHTYSAASIFTVTARRVETGAEFRARQAIQVPCTAGPVISTEEDTSDATRMTTALTWDNGTNGPVTINWGDGSPAEDGAAAGTSSHQYAADGDYTITVTDADNPAGSSTVQVTVPYGAVSPQVTAEADPDDPSGQTVLLTIDNTGV